MKRLKGKSDNKYTKMEHRMKPVKKVVGFLRIIEPRDVLLTGLTIVTVFLTLDVIDMKKVIVSIANQTMPKPE